MTISDNLEGKSDEMSIHQLQKFMSRRSLLKTMGLTVVGAVTSTMPIPLLSIPLVAASDVTDPILEKALQIVGADQMFQDVQSELLLRDFHVEPSKDTVQYSSSNGIFVGVGLRHSRSASPRAGADVVLTVDVSPKIDSCSDDRRLMSSRHVLDY